MNKNFLEHYMKTKPETMEQKYLFLVDEQEIAFAVIAAGYYAVALLPEKEGYYDVESFIGYMGEIACTGTYQTDYCYVAACSMKKTNDLLEQFFQNNYLTFRKGWSIFKNKEYLAKLEYQQELKSVLSDFIKRFESRQNEPPDLNRFHKFNEQGKRIGVFDMDGSFFYDWGNTLYL